MTIVKLGLDVHADQITVCQRIDGRLPQPSQRHPWEQVLELVRVHW